MEFSRELVTELWESGARFSKIMFIPALAASQDYHVSDDFQEFLEDAFESYQGARLLAQCPELKHVIGIIEGSDSKEIQDWAHDIAQDIYQLSGEHKFLVLLSISIPCRFQFNDNGEFVSCSTGGAYHQLWVLAKDMQEAARLAIAEAEQIFNTECQKAKQIQGFK